MEYTGTVSVHSPWPAVLALAVTVGTSCTANETVTVFAAASTASVVEASVQAWSERTGVPVTVSAGATSVLVRQIQSGARADVLVSAHPEWAEKVDGLERWDWLTNGLVEFTVSEPVGGGRGDCIAVGDPEHVPVGMHYRAELERQGGWSAVAARIVPVSDAPSALVAVKAGVCPVGVAYRTDLVGQAGLRVTKELPSASAIRVPVVVRTQKGTELAEWLRSEPGTAAARSAGFGVADG